MKPNGHDIEDALGAQDRRKLLSIAQGLGIENAQWLTRGQLIEAILASDRWAVRKSLALRGPLAFILPGAAALLLIAGGLAAALAFRWKEDKPGGVAVHIPSMLETELQINSNHIVMLQSRGAGLEFMQPTDRAGRLAKFVDKDADAYAKALQAAATRDYVAAERLLSSGAVSESADPLEVARLRATIAGFSGDFARARGHWNAALAIAGDDPKILSEAAYAAFGAGDFSDSLELHQRAADACTDFPSMDAINHSAAWNNSALVLQILGRYDEAEGALKKALEIAAPLGESTIHYTDLEHHLATLYENRGRYAEAVPLLRSVYESKQVALGARHPDLIFRRAQLYFIEGNVRAAIETYAGGRELLEERHGESHPDMPRHFRRLGELYEANCEYAKAESCYRRSLLLTEPALGRAHPHYAEALGKVGGVLRATCRYGEARGLYEEALHITGEALGTGHPEYARCLNDLAAVRQNLGDYAGAEAARRTALEVMRANFGENHPQYAAYLGAVGGSAATLGRFEEAESLLEQALAIDRVTIGEEHLGYAAHLKALANVRHSMGRYELAEEGCRRALEIVSDALGPDHPDTIGASADVARVLTTMGAFDEAEAILQRGLAVTAEMLGGAHLNLAAYANDAGLLAEQKGDLAAAERYFESALATAEGAVGARHIAYARVLANLARIHTESGNLDEAAPEFRDALELDRALLGPRHPLIAYHLANFAACQAASGDAVGAVASCEQALAIAEASLGKSHIDLTFVLEQYGASLRAAGVSAAVGAIETRAASILEEYAPAKSFARYGLLIPRPIGR